MDNSDIQITDVQQKCHLHAGYENLHTQLVKRIYEPTYWINLD